MHTINKMVPDITDTATGGTAPNPNQQLLNHGLSEKLLRSPVQRIQVSFQAEKYGIKPDAHKYTHAVIYLLISDACLIQLDMQLLSLSGFVGNMMIRQRDSRKNVEQKSIRQWTFSVAPGLQVHDFIQLIEQNRRHLYIFHHTGVGCRHWV